MSEYAKYYLISKIYYILDPEPPEIQTVTLRVPSRPTTPVPVKPFSKNKRRGVIEWIGEAGIFMSKLVQ